MTGDADLPGVSFFCVHNQTTTMQIPFNKLTSAQAERLDLIQEECAEVIHIIAKIKRHGYDSFNPTVEGCPGNRKLLAIELGHLTAAVSIAKNVKDFDFDIANDASKDKLSSINQYLHHNVIQ